MGALRLCRCFLGPCLFFGIFAPEKKYHMHYRTLGRTELKVSLICLGTMTFGEQNSEQDGHAQLSYAVDQGINFIDTAELYAVPARAATQGATERIIGTWLRQRSDRDQLIIASKIGGPRPGLTYLRNPMDFKPASIRAALEGSLQRLQTDYLDLYQLHWPVRRTNFFGQLGYPHQPEDKWEDDFQEILETMSQLIREGKIRHFGISNETPWGLSRFLHLAEQHGLPRCVSIQNPYSLLNRTFEVGLAEMAIREEVGLLAYSPLAFGMLTGKYHQGPEPENGRLRQFPELARYNGALSYEATKRYLDIANRHALSLAQMALAFVNSRPFVASNIIGATTLTQLKENIESFPLTLSAEILQEIEAVHHEIPNPAP